MTMPAMPNLDDMTNDKRSEGFTYPFKEFKGKLVKVEGEYITPKRPGANTYLQLTYKFVDVKDVVCNPGQTYPHPVAEIKLAHSESGNSRYAIWTDSIAQIMQRDGVKNAELYGKELHVGYTAGHEIRQLDTKTNQWGPVKVNAWTVIAVDGNKAPVDNEASDNSNTSNNSTSSVEFNKIVVDMADGKNIKEIGKALLGNDMPEMLKKVSIEGKETAFIQGFVSAKLLSVDANGVYHKV